MEIVTKDIIKSGLGEQNHAKMEQTYSKDLAVYLVEHDQIVGGLIGYTHGDQLFIRWLWISPLLREQNKGTEVL